MLLRQGILHIVHYNCHRTFADRAVAQICDTGQKCPIGSA